jgi:glycosyltransferase involved in cell wall biosynthesis
MTAIIIPAHNESTSIEATLSALLESLDALEADHLENAEVIVVCNGCTDDTAQRAGRFAPRVRVLETTVASKTHALNLGDEAARSYPRLYLDADVRVSKSLVGDLVQALDDDRPLVAYPAVEFDLRSSSTAVRAFYDVWQWLPYNRPGRIGVGLYALNRPGRERFPCFPEVISDDGFVRGHFSEDECRIVRTCQTTVRAPATLSSLVKIKTRSRLGLYQLRRRFPHVLQQRPAPATWCLWRGALGRLCKFPIYVSVNVLARLRAARQVQRLEDYRWERDESTRTVLANGATP